MGNPPPERARERSIPPDTIDASTLARAFVGGAEALRQQADALNAINVFPVPDGDTGTNMSLTMRAAIDEIERTDRTGVGAIAAAAAQGALMGAKGNSGVILSQIISGFASACDGRDDLDAPVLASALKRGREAAYRVVSAPKEGTILTAITAAAQAASDTSADGTSVDETLAAALAAAHDAVARTPDLLPVLREAGVVDAGAQGLAVLLDGMQRGLRGEQVAAGESFGSIDASWLAATQRAHSDGATSGFCTEFVIEGAQLDADVIRAHLSEGGDSLLVVGGDTLVRVHVHTQAPNDALAYARTLGAVSHEKVDNMESQFQSLAARLERDKTPVAGIAVVAIGAGDGIEELLRSMGASVVVRGGQTMNPSAGEIRAAIESTGAADVFVLPNNKNVVLAAEQAAASLTGNVSVLATKSIPQGVAALVVLNPEATVEENLSAMAQAITSVRTGEVTHAARATRIHGLDIKEGQPIGLIDGDLRIAADSVGRAVRDCVALLVEGRDAALVTLYTGEGEDEAAAAAIAETLRADFNIDIEVVAGGQPHYPYLIGVE